MPPNHIRRLSLLFSFLCRMKRQSSVQQRPPTPLSLSIRHFSSASPPIQPHSAFFLASLFNCLRRVQIWSDQALSIVGKMRAWSAVLLVVAVALAAAAEASKSKPKVCNKGWECSGSIYCCNETISDYFKVYQFENLFSKRNSPVAHAVGFWDYQSFILAASLYEPLGFGTTGDKVTKMQEVAAFLGHVGSKTSCGYGVATGGPLAWGLCYNHEMSPSQDYCDPNYLYPCVDGVQYYGRGALPVYWNYNYGLLGDAIKADLLNHPEYLEQNATLAFQAAMWRWMTPIKKKQPSAHDVFVGNWKPTKNDTLSKRLPGFGLTMNILYGDLICGQGFIDPMNNIISHYQYYLDLMGVGRGNSGDNVDCAEQVVFNPSYKADTAT